MCYPVKKIPLSLGIYSIVICLLCYDIVKSAERKARIFEKMQIIIIRIYD